MKKKKAQETFLQPLMNSINNLGAIVKYQSFSSPLAFLKVTKSQLKQIESLPKVVRIYLDDDTIQAKDLCSTGVITTRTYELWDRGFNGGLGPIARTDQNQVVEILASGGLYVRKGPSTSYPAIASVSQGQEFAVLRWENYWAEIKYDLNKVGWISMGMQNQYAIGKLPGTGEIVVPKTSVNIRSGPSTSNAIIYTVQVGAELIVLSSTSGWYYVKLPQGILGWVTGNTEFVNVVRAGTSPTGRQTRIAILEASGVDFTNPNISQSKLATYPGLSDYNTAESAPHGTEVAGIIAGIGRGMRGHAFGAKILNARPPSRSMDDYVRAADWAIDNNADVINGSFGFSATGQLDALTRYFDHIARRHFRLSIFAAGNGGANSFVTTPAIGHNVLAVGAIDDLDTGLWSDDVITTFSSSNDPLASNNPKPELCAPGLAIHTTVPASFSFQVDTDGDGVLETYTASDGETSYYDRVNLNNNVNKGDADVSGTSFAAPAVSAIAALLMEASSTNLQAWPELVRAILMAGATNEVTTGANSGVWDAREGIGTVNAYSSYQIIANGRYFFSYASSTAFPLTQTVYLQAGQKLRVVLTWNSQPSQDTTSQDHVDTYATFTDAIQVNLDLELTDSNGLSLNPAVRSARTNSTVEAIEYTASVAGNYIIKVINTTWNSDSSEPIAFAWHIY